MVIILEAIHTLTNDYGLSIIFLSILINIIIIPLHYVGDFLAIQHKRKLVTLKPKIDLLRNEFKGQEQHLYLKTLYRVNNYHPLSSLKASIGLILQVPFFIAAFHLLGNYGSFDNNSFLIISDLGQPDRLLFGINLLPILMTVISLFSSYVYSKKSLKSEKFQLYSLSLLFLILLYFESSALLIYWTVGNIFSLSRNWIEERIKTNSIRDNLIKILVTLAHTLKRNNQIKFIINNIYFQSSLLFFGLIFVYKAIPIAASDTGMYGADYKFVVLNLLIFFLSSITITLILYRFINNKWRDILMRLIAFGAFSGLFFSFIMPFEIEKINALAIPPFYIYESIVMKLFKLSLLIPLIILWFILFNKIKKIVWFTLFLANIILIVNAFSAGLSPRNFDVITYENYSTMSSNEANKFYAFSKESNTLVIMLDMFQGNIFADIINENPELLQQFSGFTYYPNTLSHGSSTWKSISAIAGGPDFQVQFMTDEIKLPSTLLMSDKLINSQKQKAYLHNMNIAQQYNHSYSIFKPSYVDCDIFTLYQDSICSNSVIINEELLVNQDFIYNPKSSFASAIFFAKLSLVLNLPHHTKNIAGRLLAGNYFSEYINNVNQYAQLQNLTDYANLNSNRKTFKFIENKLTHTLWMLNEECEIVNENFDDYQGLYNSAFCSVKLLNDFFIKLKSLEIYDKTKIIIVSDHGSSSAAYGKFFIDTKNFKIQPSASSALLLVKDFYQSEDLKTSMEFMSNMDTYGIALSGVSENKNIFSDRIKKPIKNRSLIYIHSVSPENSYNITEAYKVTNNIFDKNNWEKLNQSQIQKLSQ